MKKESLKKVYRYFSVYGLGRTLFKVAGRTRSRLWGALLIKARRQDAVKVGVLGCGQFSFATIGYFLNRAGGYRIDTAFDPDPQALASFSGFHKVAHPAKTEEEFFSRKLDLVYVVSNHASHADYAVKALAKGSTVFVEKPIAVDWAQFRRLGAALSRSDRSDLYVGYNRPFSRAVREIVQLNKGMATPFSLSCFVVGHFIDELHWYRRPEEGTRVCGNLGHWIDLTVHLLFQKSLPRYLDVRIACSNEASRDDDMAVTLVSDVGDLAVLTLTSRAEPFEGINESITFNQGDLIANIVDFRRAIFWKGSRRIRHRYFPKDVGHERAILQPANRKHYRRDLEEVRLSTALMLEIKDLVEGGRNEMRFVLADDKYAWSAEVGGNEDPATQQAQ